MHQVTGQYEDFSKMNRKAYFYLNADKEFNPYTWRPPIHWLGRVGGVEISFTQTSNSSSHRDDYDWSDFPQEVQDAIPYIIEAIDRAMRVMD